MVKQKSGSIVNIGSDATRTINRVPYSAAKGGVHAITVCLAFELVEHGIRVNCISPGGIDVGPGVPPRGLVPQTEQEIAWRKQMIARDMQDTPMKRMESPKSSPPRSPSSLPTKRRT